MVYIKAWTEFETAAIDLYGKSPNRVRYCVKFKPRTGKLILKITDDTTCIMYKTFSSIILNRFESLNLRLLSQIANLPRPAPQPIATSSLLAPPALSGGGGSGGSRAGTPMGEEDEIAGGLGGAGTPAGKGAAGGAQTGGGGGGKKKKKGKR